MLGAGPPVLVARRISAASIAMLEHGHRRLGHHRVCFVRTVVVEHGRPSLDLHQLRVA